MSCTLIIEETEERVMEALAQIFTGKNGATIAGIIGIVALVVADKVIEHGYKISGTTENGGFSFEPTSGNRNDQIVDVEDVREEVAYE